MLGLVNIVKITGEATTRSRGGALGGLLVGAVVVLLLVTGLSWLYRAAESALVGIAASSAEANRVAAWAFAIVLVLLAAGGVGWVLLGRRRAVRDEPVHAAFTAEVEHALAAQRRAQALPTARRQAIDSPTSAPLARATATRLDRLPGGGGR